MQSPGVSPSGSPAECPCQEPENPGGGGGPSLPPSSPGASWPSQTAGQTHAAWVDRAHPSEDAASEAPTPARGTGNCPLLGPRPRCRVGGRKPTMTMTTTMMT